ncbi:MAG: hypothetical protein LQ346_006143 [Caloplaca aetnensis]|nr:MAG: hypothetical protein LQ346_006143 [Caloplaca aetnensis]
MESSPVAHFTPSHPWGFLSLPFEIRNMIYPLLVCTNSSAHPCDERDAYTLDRLRWSMFIGQGASRLYPAILQTCKQINAEATPLLYLHNAFRFSDPTQALSWIHAIPKERVSLVRNMTIWLSSRKRELELLKEVLQMARGLRRLHIHTERMHALIIGDYVKDFPGTVVPWLEEHGGLKVAMSPWNGGLYIKERRHGGYLEITFLRSERDGLAAGEGGYAFNLRRWCRAVEVRDRWSADQPKIFPEMGGTMWEGVEESKLALLLAPPED